MKVINLSASPLSKHTHILWTSKSKETKYNTLMLDSKEFSVSWNTFSDIPWNQNATPTPNPSLRIVPGWISPIKPYIIIIWSGITSNFYDNRSYQNNQYSGTKSYIASSSFSVLCMYVCMYVSRFPKFKSYHNKLRKCQLLY